MQLELVPIDDKVGPEVAHDSGNFPIFIAEVEHSSGEKVEKLIAVSNTTRDGRLLAWEQEVPQRCISTVFKRIKIILSSGNLIELHKLISRGFDEECSNKLEVKSDETKNIQKKRTYIYHPINHLVPVTQHVICEVAIVDQLIDDTTVIF